MPLSPSANESFESLREARRGQRLPGVDGMRAIAVGLVMVYHFGVAKAPASLGVLLFFVISGFLITWLLLKEFDRTAAVSLSSFYERRASRIFPAFYVYLAIMTATFAFSHHPIPWLQLITASTYTSDYYIGLAHPAPSYVSHTWSLSIEEQFYLIWPMALVLLLKWQKRLQLTRIVIGVVLLIWIYRWILVAMGVTDSYIYNAFECRFDHLLIGCLTAILLWEGRLSRIGMPKVFSPFGFWMGAIALGISGVCDGWVPNYRNTVGFVIEPVLCALMLLQCFSQIKHGAVKWLEWSPIRYLGRISYSVYLYQQVTLHPFHRLDGHLPQFFIFLVASTFTIGIASLSFYLIEQPCLRLFRRSREVPTIIVPVREAVS